jgi:FAD/FMN-containing dehydrogenase
VRDLVESLRNAVGWRHVLTEDSAIEQQDYTGRYRGRALAVVRPGAALEVTEVIAACRAAGVAIVPQGGHTGLVGGGTPRGGEVVVSTARLTSIELAGGAATVGAGVTLAELRRSAAAAGRRFPLDIASRDSATVGGMIATDAAGAHGAAAGSMGNQLMGVEAVLADGAVVDELDGGESLLPVIAGSEGTLAVITRARLRLQAPLSGTVTALVGVASAAEAWRLAENVLEIEAAEIFYRNGLEQVCAAFGLGDPLPQPFACYLLVEAGGLDPLAALGGALQSVGEPAVAVAESATDRDRLWRFREAHTDAILRRGVPIKADLRLPVAAIDAFVLQVAGAVASMYPGATTFVYGHLLDGDLHINVTGADAADHGVDVAIYTEVAKLGGSVVGEHGIGVAKVDLLDLTEDAATIAAMRATKDRFDPLGILNPGVRVPQV